MAYDEIMDAVSDFDMVNAKLAAILEQLTEKSGKKAPAPLASLAGKSVRFTQVTEKDDMIRVVDQILR